MANEEKAPRSAKKGDEAVPFARVWMTYTTKEGFDGGAEVVAPKLSTTVLKELEVIAISAGAKPRGLSLPTTSGDEAATPHCLHHPDREMRRFTPKQREFFGCDGWYCNYRWNDRGQQRFCNYKLDLSGNELPPREPGD